MVNSGCRGCQVVNCSKLYCLLFTKDAGSYVLGSAHFVQQVYEAHQEDGRRKRESTEALSPASQPRASTPMSLPAPFALREGVLVMAKLEEYVCDWTFLLK